MRGCGSRASVKRGSGTCTTQEASARRAAELDPVVVGTRGWVVMRVVRLYWFW